MRSKNSRNCSQKSPYFDNKDCKPTSNWRHLRAWNQSSENTERKRITKIGRTNQLLVTKEHEKIKFREKLERLHFRRCMDSWWVRIWTAQNQGTSVVSKKGPRPAKAVPKFGQKIMASRALFYRGFYLKILDGKAATDSRKNSRILAHFVLFADEEGWILQKDGTTPHTSAKIKNWLSENNIQFLQRPQSSADPSPIQMWR